MVLQPPRLEGALNARGFQGEKLGCREGAGCALGVFGGGCGWGLGGHVPPQPLSMCVQYIVLLLNVSQGDDESLTVFPEL